MSYKTWADSGLNALADVIKQNRADIADQGTDIQTLTDQFTSTMQEVDSCLDALDSGKKDKSTFTCTILAQSGWVEISGGYAYDLADAAVTVSDSSETIVDPSCQTAASECGMATVSETGDGTIRYTAKEIPALDIAIQYRIIQGVSTE